MHKICYSFKKDSVTIEYNKQYICFHSYAMNEKGKFREFQRELATTQPQKIGDVFGLANRSHVNSIGVSKAIKPIDTVIIF